MKKILLLSILMLTSCSLSGIENSSSNELSTAESITPSTPIESSTPSSSTIPSSSSTPSSSTKPSSSSTPSSSTKPSSSSTPSSSTKPSSSSTPSIELKDFTLKDSEITLNIGQTYQISATFNPSNATNKKLSYSISNNNIATVSSTGLVTAKSNGTAYVYISSANNIQKSMKLVVGEAKLPGLLSYQFEQSVAPTYTGEYFYANQLNPQVTNLGTGVVATRYSYNATNGKSNVKVWSLIVDLNYATIEAGSPNNTYFNISKQIVSEQIKAYQNATTRKVYAGVNGDFFGLGLPNGAMIKDGVVVSAKSTDYGGLVNGMWGFGVTYNNVPRIINVAPNANTFYRFDNYIELYDSSAKMLDKYVIDYINDNYLEDHYIGSARARNYELITKSGQAVSGKNVVYLEKIASYDNKVGDINIPFDAKITSISKKYSGSVTLNDNQAALVVSDSFLNKAKTNMLVRVGTTYSDNSDYNGLKTYIGGRHLLLQNYQIAPNLNKETSNGGTGKNSRTCIGITGDGKVVIVTCGSYNFNLTDAADFLRYLGCRDAMNFDGGGSTGMFTRNTDGSYAFVSGYNSRPVSNSVLVVEK